MSKTLYSLMLSEDVVRAVDAAAHRLGASRSALVDRVLAEYVGLSTPEQRIGDVFSRIEQLLMSDRELVPCVVPNASTMSMKSALRVRYRPTVKYSVELYRASGDSLGVLTAAYRTQSAELLEAMERFFRLWRQTEERLLSPLLTGPIPYSLTAGRFTRALVLPSRRDYTADELAGAISGYVRFMDACLKRFLAGELTAEQLESDYASRMQAGAVLI